MFDFTFRSAKKLLECANDKANEEHDQQDHHCDENGGDDRVGGGEPSQSDGADIFAYAEGSVGKRFGRGRDGGAGGDLPSVGGKGDSASENRGHDLDVGRQASAGVISEQGGDGDANEGVQCVPDEVEGGNFVGKEFDGKECETNSDYPPGFNQVQGRGNRDDVQAGEESEGGYGGVDVESGSKAGADDQPEDVLIAELHLFSCPLNCYDGQLTPVWRAVASGGWLGSPDRT